MEDRIAYQIIGLCLAFVDLFEVSATSHLTAQPFVGNQKLICEPTLSDQKMCDEDDDDDDNDDAIDEFTKKSEIEMTIFVLL